MTTHHVLDQLPLWVEGDLSGPESEAVRAHLSLCDSCRAAEERLRTSLVWLREAMEPPFGTSDREHLRRAVMDEIRKAPSRPSIRRFVVRPALLAACAASLLMATLIWRQERGNPAQVPRPEALPAPKVMAIAPQPDLRPTQALREATRLAQTSRRMPLAQNTESPPQAEPARIEFQTADPTIRIIWLARATPLPDTTLPLPEEP